MTWIIAALYKFAPINNRESLQIDLKNAERTILILDRGYEATMT